jgi:hypothetical protein
VRDIPFAVEAQQVTVGHGEAVVQSQPPEMLAALSADWIPSFFRALKIVSVLGCSAFIDHLASLFDTGEIPHAQRLA